MPHRVHALPANKDGAPVSRSVLAGTRSGLSDEGLGLLQHFGLLEEGGRVHAVGRKELLEFLDAEAAELLTAGSKGRHIHWKVHAKRI